MADQRTADEPHVVITGASGRLGRLLVASFAARGATVSGVVRTERDRERIIVPPEAPAPAVFACDLLDPEATRRAFDDIVDRSGAPDSVIHTVGSWAITPIADTSVASWRTTMETNLTSTFVCAREAVRVMSASGGVFIAFASGQGADGGAAKQGAYSAAKAGVIRLVESIDAEYGSADIRAHAIAPSYIIFDDDDAAAAGVRAGELADLCRYLSGPSGDALRGQVIRAYGTLQ